MVVAEAGAGRWRIRLADGAAETTITSDGLAPVGRKVVIAVRPEHLAMGAPGGAMLAAKVHDAFRGNYYVYELDVNGREASVFVYGQARQLFAAGGQVGLGWQPDCAVLLQDAG